MSIRDLIEEYTADVEDLSACYSSEYSVNLAWRLDQLDHAWIQHLTPQQFANLDLKDRTDAWLFFRHLEANLQRRSGGDAHQLATVTFGFNKIFELLDALFKMEFLTGPQAALDLDLIREDLVELDVSQIPPTFQARMPKLKQEFETILKTWNDFYVANDPEFAWWTSRTVSDIFKIIADLEVPKDLPLAAVAPVGEEELIGQLKFNSISLHPSDLIGIANRDMAFCREQMEKAANDMGCETVEQAIEKCKDLAVPPGRQPHMVRELLVEAIDLVQSHDLLTVSPMSIETIRMQMLTQQQQITSPFFLGGDKIYVSYATDGMTFDEKQMSMRGNNPAFSRATVQHELIPGHHTQWHSTKRFKKYRELFWTPFWVEGWTIHWEMLLWDIGFPRTPEQVIGMMFWRSHRAARVVFSLGYHTGTMTAEECVEMLVNQVGHERANAEAEVRRSFSGDYDPLYQLAYLIGGKMMRSICRKKLEDGWTLKRFHDAVMAENNINLGALRLILDGDAPTAIDADLSWHFGDQLEPLPVNIRL